MTKTIDRGGFKSIMLKFVFIDQFYQLPNVMLLFLIINVYEEKNNIST